MKIEREGTLLTVSDLRELTAVNAGDLGQALRERVDHNTTLIKIDLSRCRYMDPSGLGAIYGLSKSRKSKIRVTLVEPSEEILQLLHFSKMIDLLTVEKTRNGVKTIYHQPEGESEFPKKDSGAAKVPKAFDVFFSYNSKDREIVTQIFEIVTKRGFKIWLDVSELKPGRRWQEAIEKNIVNVHATAIFIGAKGFGRWHEQEMRMCLDESVRRDLAVIPVLLPEAPDQLQLPPLLTAFTWVDLRGGVNDEGIERLIWGIRK